MIYQLSDKGRELTWKQWQKLGGCYVPNNSMAGKTVGSESTWLKNNVTLGQIEDDCPYTGRALAGFALRVLDKKDLAKPYESVLV
jgi:hypothetical protein